MISWHHPRCHCWRDIQATLEPVSAEDKLQSTCGPSAVVRGHGQKVISYSFFGKTDSVYFQGVATNTELVQRLYKNWIVRLYHNIPPNDTLGIIKLCDVVCKFPILDECYVGDLRDILNANLLEKDERTWRFMVMGDCLVSMFASRDLDSPVYQREVDAVQEWISENKTWHIMRDNPAHVTTVLVK